MEFNIGDRVFVKTRQLSGEIIDKEIGKFDEVCYKVRTCYYSGLFLPYELELIAEHHEAPIKEEKQQFKVGDIVFNSSSEHAVLGVITHCKYNSIYILWSDGSCGQLDDNIVLHKLNENVDFSKFIKELKTLENMLNEKEIVTNEVVTCYLCGKTTRDYDEKKWKKFFGTYDICPDCIDKIYSDYSIFDKLVNKFRGKEDC